MTKKAFTLRLDPQKKSALEVLSKLLKRPINQLLNEAITLYIHQQTPEESALKSSLEKLTAYRKADPEYKQAINRIIDSEIDSPVDPAQGTIIEGEFVNGVLIEKPKASSHQSLRQLLDA